METLPPEIDALADALRRELFAAGVEASRVAEWVDLAVRIKLQLKDPAALDPTNIEWDIAHDRLVNRYLRLFHGRKQPGPGTADNELRAVDRATAPPRHASPVTDQPNRPSTTSQQSTPPAQSTTQSDSKQPDQPDLARPSFAVLASTWSKPRIYSHNQFARNQALSLPRQSRSVNVPAATDTPRPRRRFSPRRNRSRQPPRASPP